MAIDPLTPTILYAGTYDGGVFKSTNGGGNWSPVNTGLTDIKVHALAIDPVTPTTLYAGTDNLPETNGGVFKSTNGGGNWSAVNTGLYVYSQILTLVIDPTTPDILYVGTGIGDGLSKSTNGGSTWSAATAGLSGMGVESLAIDPAMPSTLYAGTYDGGVFKSTNGGGNWSAFNVGLPATRVHALAIDPVTPKTLYAGTQHGVFAIQQTDMKYRINLPFISYRTTFTTCDSVDGIPRVECEALVSLYSSTDGPGWTNHDGWLVTNTPCSWYGVTCVAGHVQELNLDNNKLSGTITPQLGNLTDLQVLYLGLPHAISIGPEVHSTAIELGNLINMQYLHMTSNQLSGAIPPQLGNPPVCGCSP